MASKIQIKRGMKASMPTLSPGEFGLATDTKELFIGTANGNLQLAVLDDNGELPSGQVDLSGYVPTSRTVNGHALTGNVTLDANDVGTLPENSILSVATKTKYGLGSEAVPDDVLAMLAGSLQVRQTTVTNTVGDAPVGTVVVLHENGTPVNFIKIADDYNGSQTTLLIRQDLLIGPDGSNSFVWAENISDPYEGSYADNYLTNTYAPQIDENSYLSPIAIDVYTGASATPNNSGVGTITRSVFLMSWADYNGNESYAWDGELIPYLKSVPLKGINWTRSPFSDGVSARYMLTNGTISDYAKAQKTPGYLPILSVSKSLPINTTTTYTLQTPTGTNVTDQVAQALGSVKVETGSYTGTGTYGESNPTTINLSGEPVFAIIAQYVYGTQDIIMRPYSGYWSGAAMWFDGMTQTFVFGSKSSNALYFTKTANSLSFYNTSDSTGSNQFNQSNNEYHYLVLTVAGGEP